MYHLKANFYPTDEPKNGYVGKASIDVASAVRISNISVFKNEEGYSLGFAEYGEKENSFVVPKSKEAYAAMLGVVVKAVEAEQHYAFENGTYGPKITVTGVRVEEPYADGRYSLQVGDLCTLNGITSRWVETEKDGKKRAFASVDMPVVRDAEGKVRMYKNAEGKDVADLQFEGLVSKWKDKEGKEQTRDYRSIIADAVKAERSKLYHKSLENQVADAKAKGKAKTKEQAAPKKKKDEKSR